MNNIDLNGRTAIVTGGADGIGGSITERFLASGASVIMWDISQDNLDAKLAASAAGDRLQGAKVDVTDPDQVAAARDSAHHGICSCHSMLETVAQHHPQHLQRGL